MRKIATFLLTLVLVCAMTVTALAESITPENGRDIAFKDAGVKASQVRALEVEREDNNNIEVEFVRKSDKAEFDYEINPEGKIVEKSVEYRYKAVKSSKKIGKTAAKKKVAKFAGFSYATVKNAKCTYTKRKGVGKYKISFRKGSYKYEYELLAKTGKVIEYEWEYVKK